MFKDLARQFPACRALLARRTWEDLRDHLEAGSEVTAFPELVDRQTGALKLPGYLADLARLELAMRKARAKGATMPRQVEPGRFPPRWSICARPAIPARPAIGQRNSTAKRSRPSNASPTPTRASQR